MNRAVSLWSAAAFAVLSVPAVAGKPSFNCARATRADELAICQNAPLSALDVRMSRDYRAVISCLGMGSRDAERESQTAWLERRAACQSNVSCIGERYRERIAELAPRAARARRQGARKLCPG